jgi:membrane protease YdiL (CAAX protease family)
MRMLLAVGLTLILFVLVYAPASALAVLFHLPLVTAVPFVMFTTLFAAGALVYGLSRRWSGGFARFGFRPPHWQYIGWAVALGAPLAVVAAQALRRVHEQGPLDGLSLAPWLAVLYFAIGAAIQEEVIFRGLLQTALSTGAAPQLVPTRESGIVASVLIALLFGCIHLTVGRYTAVAALILGVLAGELRRRSGSLAPAMICHSFFNLAGIIWH